MCRNLNATPRQVSGDPYSSSKYSQHNDQRTIEGKWRCRSGRPQKMMRCCYCRRCLDWLPWTAATVVLVPCYWPLALHASTLVVPHPLVYPGVFDKATAKNLTGKKSKAKEKMFDSKMMVETTEEQPPAEAAMMASAMAGRADAFGDGAIGSSDEMLPAKTVRRQCQSASARENDR